MTKELSAINQSIIQSITAFLFLCCMVGFYTIFLNNGKGREILYFSSTLFMLVGVFGVKWQDKPKQNIALVATLFAMSLSYLLWYYMFRSPGDFKSLYTQFQRLGRSLMMTSVLVFIVSNTLVRLPHALVKSIFILGGLGINLYAIYLAYDTQFNRVTLDIQTATTAAYTLTLLDIFMLHSLLQLRGKWRYVFFQAAFFLGYCAIITTGTRSAMIVYPIVTVGILSFDPFFTRKKLMILLAATLTAMIIALTMLKSIIHTRFLALETDVELLQNDISATSIGSRIALLQIGWEAGLLAPFGQSVESRSETAKQLGSRDPLLNVTEEHLHNHMHNDILESFSLRGIPGVTILCIFYLALLVTALRSNNRNICLLMIATSMMLYGISDVIFFQREGYLLYLTGIVFAIAFAPKFDRRRTMERIDHQKRSHHAAI